jgi:hypothetical protein
MPSPVSLTVSTNVMAVATDVGANLAAMRSELQGIRQEIQNHVLQTGGILYLPKTQSAASRLATSFFARRVRFS